MIPQKIILKNYKSYGEEETEIDLNGNEVTLVFGNIGAGKTTFVDGIIWCLYGESLVNQDEVINRQNKKDCKVEYIFKIKEDLYSVIRYRKHNVFKDGVSIFKNHKNITPVKKKDAQDLIDSIVGMNHKAVISSIMFSSEIYISFLRSTEAKRLEIFESVLNMNVFKKWAAAAKNLKAPLEEEYEMSKLNIDKLEYGKKTILQSIDEYKEDVKNKLVKFQVIKKELEAKKNKKEQELKALLTIDLEKELDKATKKNEIDAYNKPINNRISEITEQIITHETNLSITNNYYNKFKTKLEKLEEIDVSLERSKINTYAKNKLLSQKIDSNNNVIKNHKNEIQKAKDQIQAEFKLIEQKKEQLSTTGTNICHTCGQKIDKEKQEKITEELIELIKSQENKIIKIKQLIKDHEIEINTLNIENNRIKDELKPLENVMNEDELNNLSDEISELKVRKANSISTMNSFEEQIRTLKEELRMKKELLKSEVEGSRYSLDFLKNLYENKEVIEENLNDIVAEIKILTEQAKNAYNKEYVNTLNEKIVKFDNKIEEISIIKNSKINELNEYQYLLKIFSNKDYGIKKYIIGKMIDVFNRNINRYIPLFFDREIKIEFDKNLTEKITENKQEISFKSFSSGEKSLLDIAVAFSLYMLVKDFFSSGVKMLVFDEILDRNLDERGINAVIEVINDLAKDNSIMIISHRQELQENFPKRIRVYKEDGFSKIEAA